MLIVFFLVNLLRLLCTCFSGVARLQKGRTTAGGNQEAAAKWGW